MDSSSSPAQVIPMLQETSVNPSICMFRRCTPLGARYIAVYKVFCRVFGNHIGSPSIFYRNLTGKIRFIGSDLFCKSLCKGAGKLFRLGCLFSILIKKGGFTFSGDGIVFAAAGKGDQAAADLFH